MILFIPNQKPLPKVSFRQGRIYAVPPWFIAQWNTLWYQIKKLLIFILLKIGAKYSRYHPTLYFGVPIRNVNGRFRLLCSAEILTGECWKFSSYRLSPAAGSLQTKEISFFPFLVSLGFRLCIEYNSEVHHCQEDFKKFSFGK